MARVRPEPRTTLPRSIHHLPATRVSRRPLGSIRTNSLPFAIVWGYQQQYTPENHDVGSNPEMVSRPTRFVEVCLADCDSTEHRCPEHRPSHSACTFDWTPTVHEICERKREGYQQGPREAETHPEEGPCAGDRLAQHKRQILCRDDQNLLRSTTYRGGYQPRDGLRQDNQIR